MPYIFNAVTKQLDYFTKDANSADIGDASFLLHDDADSTKVLAFELSSISPSTTRTLTVPDSSGTIALTSDSIIVLYTTVALAEAAGGTDNDLCYVVETDTFYRYEASGSTFTDDNLYVLSTNDGGDTRWLGIAGSRSITAESSPFKRRVSNGLWEIVAANVEYYDGYHKGVQVYYQEFSGTPASDLNGNTISGMTAEIDSGGSGMLAALRYPFPYADSFAADQAHLNVDTWIVGSNWNGAYSFWVRYLK